MAIATRSPRGARRSNGRRMRPRNHQKIVGSAVAWYASAALTVTASQGSPPCARGVHQLQNTALSASHKRPRLRCATRCIRVSTLVLACGAGPEPAPPPVARPTTGLRRTTGSGAALCFTGLNGPQPQRRRGRGPEELGTLGRGGRAEPCPRTTCSRPNLCRAAHRLTLDRCTRRAPTGCQETLSSWPGNAAQAGAKFQCAQSATTPCERTGVATLWSGSARQWLAADPTYQVPADGGRPVSGCSRPAEPRTEPRMSTASCCYRAGRTSDSPRSRRGGAHRRPPRSQR